MAWVCTLTAKVPTGDLARAVRVGVAEHGVVVVLRPRSQARQLRQVQVALRAGGFRARYFTDGAALCQLLVTAPGQDMPRVVGWWGG